MIVEVVTGPVVTGVGCMVTVAGSLAGSVTPGNGTLCGSAAGVGEPSRRGEVVVMRVFACGIGSMARGEVNCWRVGCRLVCNFGVAF